MELFEITSVVSEYLAEEIADNIGGMYIYQNGKYIIQGNKDARYKYRTHYGWRDRMTYNVMHLSKKY